MLFIPKSIPQKCHWVYWPVTDSTELHCGNIFLSLFSLQDPGVMGSCCCHCCLYCGVCHEIWGPPIICAFPLYGELFLSYARRCSSISDYVTFTAHLQKRFKWKAVDSFRFWCTNHEQSRGMAKINTSQLVGMSEITTHNVTIELSFGVLVT